MGASNDGSRPVGASNDRSQEMPNFTLEMWSDLFTKHTLRFFDVSDVLGQVPVELCPWNAGTLCQKYSRYVFDCDGYGILYLEKGLKNWNDHVYCGWCLECSIIYFGRGRTVKD